MAGPTRSRQVRLTVVLDTRVALEALLITALRRNPTARRQEWLRQVLLQGFRSECLGLRQAMTDSPAPVAAPLHIAPGSNLGQMAPTSAEATADAPLINGTQSDKPLAGLRKLIG